MNRTFGLRHAADRRSIAFAACHFILVALSITLWQRGFPEGVFIPFIACSAFIQLISTHNAMHSPVFKQRRMNRFWQCVLSMGIGYPVSVFVPVHNLSHHMHLQTPKDILRTTEVRHRSNLLNLVHHMIMGTVHLHLLHAAYLGSMRRSHPKWFSQVVCEILAVVLLLAGVGVLVSPRAALTLVLLPSVVGQLLIVGFGYVQHDGCEAESEYNHSRNFVGRVFNWFIFDNGFHTVHHNRPGVHWSEGRAAHAALVVPHMHKALDEASLLRYMWRAFMGSEGRRRFDGAPVQLPEARRDRELWTPVTLTGASTGAIELS